MSENKKVSVQQIRAGKEYLEEQFLRPLEKVGETLIEQYRELSQVLNSENINKRIVEQQNKLDDLKNDFKKIFTKVSADMDTSSKVIAANQNVIDETLSNI